MSTIPDESTGNQSIGHYLAILRRRFVLIAVITILTVLAAAAYTFTRPPVYRATTQIVVGQGKTLFTTEVGSAADQFTQTMSDLLESHIVARRVIDELDLNISPTELLSKMEVATKPQNAVLSVSYDDTNADRGLAILEQISNTFPELIRERFAPDDTGEVTAEGEIPQEPITATVYDDAHTLPDPVWPKPLLNLAVALLLGLALGIVAAFVRDQLDDRIRNVVEAEKAFGQAASATLPHKFLGHQPLAAPGKQRRRRKRLDPVLAEFAVQKLRAGVIWSWEAGQEGTLLVTSAQPEEGKTTIATNLAVSTAREGHDVIIVDADLRRPQVHAFLNIDVGSDTKGIDDVLRGDVVLADALVDVPLDPGLPSEELGERGRAGSDGQDAPPPGGRLRAIVSSPGETRPSEFAVDRVNALIEELRGHADYVIFDAPPMLVVTDAYPLIVAADTVVAVVRNEKATSATTFEMARTLARLRVRNVRRGELVVTDVKTDLDAGRYSYYSVRTAPGPAR